MGFFKPGFVFCLTTLTAVAIASPLTVKSNFALKNFGFDKIVKPNELEHGQHEEGEELLPPYFDFLSTSGGEVKTKKVDINDSNKKITLIRCEYGAVSSNYTNSTMKIVSGGQGQNFFEYEYSANSDFFTVLCAIHAKKSDVEPQYTNLLGTSSETTGVLGHGEHVEGEVIVGLWTGEIDASVHEKSGKITTDLIDESKKITYLECSYYSEGGNSSLELVDGGQGHNNFSLKYSFTGSKMLLSCIAFGH